MSENGIRDIRSAALDEECEAYPCPGAPSLFIRPWSLNAIRRARMMGLAELVEGSVTARPDLSPSDLRHGIELLAWLISAPLEEVRAAARSEQWPRRGRDFGSRELRAFLREFRRVRHLLDACRFVAEPRPLSPAELKASADMEPPEDLFAPDTTTSVLAKVARLTNRPADWLAEWCPACQVMLYAHCAQWENPAIWTLRPADQSGDRGGVDPWAEVPVEATKFEGIKF